VLLASLDVTSVSLFGSDPVVELFLGADVLPEDVTAEVVRKLTDVVGSVLRKERE
jgi:hypothetical protein